MRNVQKVESALALDNLSASKIARKTGLSQPTISRTLKKMPVVKLGKGRGTRFALIDSNYLFSFYTISEVGNINRTAQFAVQPDGRTLLFSGDWYFEYDGLPYFFYDAVPGGFLGKLQLTDLAQKDDKVRADTRQWNDHDILYFLTHYGDDLPGNWFLGEPLLATVSQTSQKVVTETDYDLIAQNMLNQWQGGSSVGGEQPKFSVYDGQAHFIVKYSPKLSADNEVAQRHRDLLVCEYVALQVLNEHGITAAQAELVKSERLYLKVQRFDRIGQYGRRGVVTLQYLDAQFVGQPRNWVSVSEGLWQQKQISEVDFFNTQVVYAFGLMIANTDMHNGNLAFYLKDGFPDGLAPIYDMLPMAYMPKQGELPNPHYQLPRYMPASEEAKAQAKRMALAFWQKVAQHQGISNSFKSLINGL